jgi:hypothetical protein
VETSNTCLDEAGVCVTDTGAVMMEAVKERTFNSLFTTRPQGQTVYAFTKQLGRQARIYSRAGRAHRVKDVAVEPQDRSSVDFPGGFLTPPQVMVISSREWRFRRNRSPLTH